MRPATLSKHADGSTLDAMSDHLSKAEISKDVVQGTVEAGAHAAQTNEGPARTELATTGFSVELAAMEKDLANGGSLERYFVALGDPALEKRAAALLRPHLRVSTTVTEKKQRRGWFSWFSRKK